MEKTKKITIAEQDLVESYQKEINQILEFLGLDPADCLVTDESSIYDFSTCYPEDEYPEDDYMTRETYQEAVDAWKSWLEITWPKHYSGVPLGVGKERYLISLAAKIRESRNVQ